MKRAQRADEILIGFLKADSRNLPSVDNDMVEGFFRNDANFISPEFRLAKVKK